MPVDLESAAAALTCAAAVPEEKRRVKGIANSLQYVKNSRALMHLHRILLYFGGALLSGVKARDFYGQHPLSDLQIIYFVFSAHFSAHCKSPPSSFSAPILSMPSRYIDW